MIIYLEYEHLKKIVLAARCISCHPRTVCSTHILTFTIQSVTDLPIGNINANSLHVFVKGGRVAYVSKVVCGGFAHMLQGPILLSFSAS